MVALKNLFGSGQENGRSARLSTGVMAVTLRSAIDALGPLLAADPDLDLKLHAKELVTLFDLATRKSPA